MSLAFIPGIGEPASWSLCAAALVALVAWAVHSTKLKRRSAEFAATLARQESDAAAALAATQKAAEEQLAAAKKLQIETTARLADVEQRFATHREVADRRQTEASQQIDRLESDLAATREVAAQLVPTQSRIKDLETALAAEQGRVQAQEQVIQATTTRATDLEKRLTEAQELVLSHKAEVQELAVELRRARDEHAAYMAAGGLEAELNRARELQQTSEAKIGHLQRALKAAETRVEMLQKEFMSAVGVASAPLSSSASTAAAGGDKKVRELEEKISQLEAEARKRAREDGYKIAELEYRLSEALDATNSGKAAPVPEVAPAPVVHTLPAPVAAPPPTPAAAEPAPVATAPAPSVEPTVAEARALVEPLLDARPAEPPPLVVEAAPAAEPVAPASPVVEAGAPSPVDSTARLFPPALAVPPPYINGSALGGPDDH